MDNITPKILTLPEAAEFLHIKVSWLARRENWQSCGGIKVAGRIIFPDKKELYDRIFHPDKKENKGAGKKRKGLEVQFSAKGDKTSEPKLQNQDGSEGSGRKKTIGVIFQPMK